ncbi:uncharacterized protein LOC129237361 [Anastrepha obliqua]|uniref:uncharacterized protein LOC129237361 n=1 Tax=Anastrepha obliqua TaxID=95512 RepID=UPI002409C106|nr:uncharacterized protein LOC129237361 [Anastrepha obliqua]
MWEGKRDDGAFLNGKGKIKKNVSVDKMGLNLESSCILRMGDKKTCEVNKSNYHESNVSSMDSKYMIYGLQPGVIEQNQPIYENMKHDLLSDQKCVLRKLFRTIEKPDTIYENLCRGCGYGVFEAKSYLCNFCSCVVGGLRNNQLRHLEESDQIYVNTGENIYENVCVKCSALYNTDACEICLANENKMTPNIFEEMQLAVAASKKDQIPTKIPKLKSFNKFNKQKLISGIFGSLKRGVKTNQRFPSGPEHGRKKLTQLDIIHHVDGSNNVFRTNETFDIQRICELKQAQKHFAEISTSDQHIYGRLKYYESIDSDTTTVTIDTLRMFRSNSQDQLQASKLDSICFTNTKEFHSPPAIKKALISSRRQSHISQPPLLDFNPQCIPDKNFNLPSDTKLALPLSNSVCYWMKLLRKQVYNYHAHDALFDDGDFTSCIPKSIPSKNVLLHTYCVSSSSYNNCSLKAFPSHLAETMTNFPVTDKKGEFKYAALMNKINSHSDSSSNARVSEQMESRFDVMVDAFKKNVMTKHLLYHQRESQPSVDHSNSLSAVPKANHLTRSTQQRTKHQIICMNNENNAAFDWPAEHSPISVINSQQALSRVGSQKCLASCCSACNVVEGKHHRCGCLNVGDRIPRAPYSEFQQKTVASVEKNENKKIKAKTLLKTETADAYNSAVASGVNKKQVKQINFIANATNNIGNNSCLANEAHLKINLVRLINNSYISYSLNTNVLHSFSNRSQYFHWLQEWLLCYYNPWSLHAKRTLKVLANCNSFEIAFKLWAILCESVPRHKSMWKYDKQGARVVMKYNRMAMQSELENVAVFDEKNSENLCVKKIVGTNSPMKTNDEVVLRIKSKESLERSKKAQGKFLDLDKNVAELNEQGLKQEGRSDNCDENIEVRLESFNEKAIVSCETKSPNGNEEQQKEEDIYQPIWKFQTVGEAHESYDSDPEYYDANSRSTSSKSSLVKQQVISYDSSIPSLLTSDNVEDHGEWETDDEFMFSKIVDGCCVAKDTTPSQTLHSSVTQGSNTKTSSNTNVASSANFNFEHPQLRAVCIFFSLSEPNIRAIIYDYKRAQASQYFSKSAQVHPITENRSKTVPITPINYLWKSSSIDRVMDLPSTPRKNSTCSTTKITSQSGEALSVFNLKSVNAWKLNLLNISYAEDEEDLIVSENEILRSQIFKEEPEKPASVKPTTLQRFKSASFGNLLEIPNEDDKKSITERMRNKLQRGVFKLNMRSPKSEKKRNGIFRPVKTGSLYLEEGMRPKFPIFCASLEQLEMNESINPNVPRFVVDCVSYIERKDCILQDGLYRASGNKVAIDELKQKLSESYIYDSKLLVADDIHTITSLLKQFFRELSSPLIPQPIYDRIGRNCSDAAGIEMLRDVLEEIPEPNHATLKFLIRHLKNVAACSMENRMPASNLAIVWGPCIFSSNQMVFVDIGRMNTLTKLLIENYEYIFRENERLVN